VPDVALPLLADRIRAHAVRMVAPQGFGYLGQALSGAELFAVLYGWALRPGTDAVVVSPGHYVVAAYAAAAEIGLVDPALLATYGRNDSTLEAIGTERSPGMDLTGGSLGQGLSAAVGFALSDRLRGRDDAVTYAVLSDGEMEEGQVWEAALWAAHHRLGQLVVLLDANNSQVDGPVDTITTLEPLAAKWESFGWAARDVDGHDTDALVDALGAVTADERPGVVIARTSTRHGLDCLPADADGHFIKLPQQLATAALAELAARGA